MSPVHAGLDHWDLGPHGATGKYRVTIVVELEPTQGQLSHYINFQWLGFGLSQQFAERSWCILVNIGWPKGII